MNSNTELSILFKGDAMGTKQDVITEIFKICKKKNDFVFDNMLVKKFSKKHEFENPFDATKLDNTSKFPEILLKSDYFIVHLGGGRHKFVKGIKNGFHVFEKIDKKNILDWKYRKSILNEFDTSESNILSVAANQKIIQDFLYEDITASPKVYNARRTKTGMSYYIGKDKILFKNLQMEIDLTMEFNGVVTVFEGKNDFPEDFAIYQLFNPFKYYSILKKENKLDIDMITGCYILRKRDGENTVLRLYNYTFEDENNIGSIKLSKSAQYNLIKR